MSTLPAAEQLFLEAERLCAQGDNEAAAIVMCELSVQSAYTKEIRERALELFHSYTGGRYLRLVCAPEASAALAPIEPTANFPKRKQPLRRHCHAASPQTATLPPELPAVVVGLFSEEKDPLTPTAEETRLLQALARDLGPGHRCRTTEEVSSVLSGYARAFRGTPSGMRILSAIVSICYAENFLDAETARALPFGVEPINVRKSVRELLMSED